MSARTGGTILLQLLFDLARPGHQVDRVLNGPTNDVWMDPWLAHLRSLGVDYRTEHQVQAIHTRDGIVTDVSIVADGRALTDTADFYVAAVPVEVMRMLATDELKQAEPQLAGLNRLRTRWMNGVMFYLDRDVPVVHGHSLYVDSLWALTSISQRQFWPGVDFEQLGDGRVEGILSVDVSDWEAQGNNGKQAMYCGSEEVCDEVWAQLKRSLNDAGVDVLEDANVLHPSSTRTSCTQTRPRRRTSSRCWSTPPAHGQPPRGDDGDREPPPRLRLRSHPHRPGHHGGRKRGSAAGRQRDPGQGRAPPNPGARCGRFQSRRSSPRRGRWTGFCSLSTARPSWRSAPRRTDGSNGPTSSRSEPPS